jgi:hypothetical protein
MRVWQLLILMLAILTGLLSISWPYVDIASKDPRFQFNDINTTNDPNTPSGSSDDSGGRF